MMTIDVDSQPLRRAALLVHAMPDADAQWLLTALSAGERAALEPLLRELGALGMPRDPALLAQVRAESGASSPSGRERTLARLDRAALRSLEGVLRAEPRAVSAMLLAVEAWPWRARIARILRVPLPVIPREGGPQFGSPLRAALVRAIEDQLSFVRQRPRRGPREWLAHAWKRLGARSEP